MDGAGGDRSALRVLRSMQDVQALEREASELQTPVETLRVLVRGQFVRKRKLSYVAFVHQRLIE